MSPTEPPLLDRSRPQTIQMVAAHTRGKIVVQVANAKDLSKGDMSSQAVMKEGELGASDGKSISKRITAVCGVSILNREKFDSLVEDMVLFQVNQKDGSDISSRSDIEDVF